jgi:hypothetical protein
MSKLFKETIQKIQKNKENFDNGKPNCIPFEWFPKLRKVIPGIMQGTNWLCTASSGVGKTQFTKHTFVYKPIKWIKDNPSSGLSIKILYFALEESKHEFMMSMICNRLYDKYNIIIDTLELQSMYETSISNDIFDKVKECEEYFNDLEKYIDIVDSISNPTGIYKYVKQYSIDNGTHYYYNFKTDKEKLNTLPYSEAIKQPDFTEDNNNAWGYSHYIPNNPDEYVEVIVDHFSLLSPEKGAETLHLAMTKMSADYGRKQITKHWNYIFINVQQQAAETEKAEFTKMGGKIEEKFKPSLANLADNKLTQRDVHIALGLFAPARYNIQRYAGYDITRLADNFRSVEVLKNRIGSGYVEDALYFNGRVNEFRELPNEMTEQDYLYIQSKRK